MKKAIVIIFAAMFCLLAAFYCLDSGRKATLALLQEKGKTATKRLYAFIAECYVYCK